MSWDCENCKGVHEDSTRECPFEFSDSSACSTAARKFRCVVFLIENKTVTTEVEDKEQFIHSLSLAMDRFHRRGMFQTVPASVRLNGNPTVVIPINHIVFYSVEEKSQ